MPNRKPEKIKSDREAIIKLVREKYADKPFTTGDMYYEFHKTWNRSTFGYFFNDLKELQKGGFLTYRMGMRKTHGGKYARMGAIYRLNPKYNKLNF